MLKATKHWLDKNKLSSTLFFGYLIFLFVVTLMPKNEDEGILEIYFGQIPFFDKLVHFGLFLILTLLLFFKEKKYNIIYFIIFPLLIGVLIETLQFALPFGRTFDVYDIFANFVGVIFAAAFISKSL